MGMCRRLFRQISCPPMPSASLPYHPFWGVDLRNRMPSWTGTEPCCRPEFQVLEEPLYGSTRCHWENSTTGSQELHNHRRHAQTLRLERCLWILSKRCLSSAEVVGRSDADVSHHG